MFSNKVCTKCGYVGYSNKETPGSFFIEIFLYLCFLVPGILYTSWRKANMFDVCPKCGDKSMIPTDAPMAKKILLETNQIEYIEAPGKATDTTPNVGTYIFGMVIVGLIIMMFTHC